MHVLKVVAGAYKGKAIFVNVPSTENRVYEFFGITKDQIPTMVLADMGSETGEIPDFRITFYCLTYDIFDYVTRYIMI